MARNSAGVLMYRRSAGGVEVLLVHPGGPFWARKDLGAWSVPKGEFGEDEDPLEAARREFQEETGLAVSDDFAPLKSIRQAGGKVVHAWAVEGDCDPDVIRSNAFSMEWPPRSGTQQEFPEVDRAAWFTLQQARDKIIRSQQPLLDQLEHILRAESGG